MQLTGDWQLRTGLEAGVAFGFWMSLSAGARGVRVNRSAGVLVRFPEVSLVGRRPTGGRTSELKVSPTPTGLHLSIEEAL